MAEFKHDQYRKLFDQSADAMLIIDNGRFVDFNDATLKMLGYSSREHLFSTHPSQLSPPTQPDGRSSFEKADEMIAIAFEKGSHRFEWIHRRADGSDFPVEVLLTPVPYEDRMLLNVVWRDITQRKKAEEALRLAKYVTDNTSEGVVVCDTTPTVIEVNPAYCEIMGYSREEILGQNPGFTKSGRHDKAFFAEMWRELSETGKWSGDIWDRRKNGEIFPKFLRINTVYNELNQPLYYIGVFSDVTRLKEAEEKLSELAFSDPLTKLPNRALFHERLEQEIQGCKRRGSKLAVFFLDLDRFKDINDTFGHASGDSLLIEVGKQIRSSVRAVDTVARMGGDEFTVIISDVKDETVVANIATHVIEAIKKVVNVKGKEVVSRASVGISFYPKDGKTVDALMRHADMAMYKAKENGGDSFSFYSEQMNIESARRLLLESEMRHGIENNQFIPYFQSIMDLNSNTLVGMEALARWQHPGNGLVLPGEFIPLAEDNGYIIPIGRSLMREACRQVRQWQISSSLPLKISVNLSGRQIKSLELRKDIESCLYESGLSPDSLTLEVTESMMMGNVDDAVKLFGDLRSAGLKIAIDDFGTGYSSLSQLKRFPVNSLKIDQSFVKDIQTDASSRTIIQTIISMADSMGLDVVAEGVETYDQLDFIKGLGCRFVQGFYFSRPLPGDSFEKVINQEAFPYLGNF